MASSSGGPGIGITVGSSPPPTYRSIEQIRRDLLYTAQTSHFECWFYPPKDVVAWMQNVNPGRLGTDYLSNDYLALSCNEASLPGSSLATHDINNDYTGVSQKHAYRRIYDDRIDFTFYVKNNYYEIMFFENWMSYITNEQFANGLENTSFNYRVRYPNTYKSTVYITKFERDYGRSANALSFGIADSPYLRYSLLEAYPISINSIPVSYEASSVLKVTVSFTFSRYIVQRFGYPVPSPSGATKNADGTWTVDFLINGSIFTTIMSNAAYTSSFAPPPVP